MAKADNEEVKKVVAPLGVIGGSGYLPQDFDIKMEIFSYRFWLMCKLRFATNEAFQKHHDGHLENLRKELLAAYPDSRIAERTITKIVTQAYNTIPGEFWSNLEKRMPLPESKGKAFPRVSRPIEEKKDSYMVTDGEAYVPYKRNKKKGKKR
jgi:hypothetical protein